MPRKRSTTKQALKSKESPWNPEPSGLPSTPQTSSAILPSEGLDEDCQSASCQAATDCKAVIMEFCNGRGDHAKESLLKLMEQYPQSALPHRYLARLLYHEASTLEERAPGVVVREVRLELLQEALHAAERATELCPSSLSSAALRATLVINELVENSTWISAKGKASTPVASDLDCTKIQKQFRESIDACKSALAADPPLRNEPAICISTSHWTFDPCSLRVQDTILPMVHEGRWEEVIAEKRKVLSCMQQVLESCHTLLDSTQIPVDGIVRLLQHILRPHQQELQLWAGQLLPGKAQVLEQLQRKFETQAAVAELLNALQPSDGEIPNADPCTHRLREPQPQDASLSVERDWNWGRDISSSQSLRRRHKQQWTRHTGHARQQQERTLRERYLEVEGFWKRAGREKRRQLTNVPLLSVLQEVHQDQSIEAAEDMADSIVALKEQGNHRSCYWTCPICEQKFHSSKDFMNHVELFHEELAVVDNCYVECTKCKNDVVGMYFSSMKMDNCTMCISCYHKEVNSLKPSLELHPFEKVFPQSPSGIRGWSDASDVMSMQGSASYYEEYVPSPRDSAIDLGDMASDSTEMKTTSISEDASSSILKAGDYINSIWSLLPPDQGSETEVLHQLFSLSDLASDPGGSPKVACEADSNECALTASSSLFPVSIPGTSGKPRGAVPQQAEGSHHLEDSEKYGNITAKGWKGWWPKRLTFTLGRSKSAEIREPNRRHGRESMSCSQPMVAGSSHLPRYQERTVESPVCHSAPPSSTLYPCLPEEKSMVQLWRRSGPVPGLTPQVDFKGADRTVKGQLIDTIVDHIQALCSTNKDTGEIALGSVAQFIHKRIGQLMDSEGLEESSKREAHKALGDLLEHPCRLVFQQLASLRGLLTCLSHRDMQNVLTYLIKQRNEALSDDGFELSDICSLESSGFLKTGDSEADEDEDEDEGEDEDDDDEEDGEELLGCISLFHVSTAIDEGVVDRALQLLWEQEERQNERVRQSSQPAKAGEPKPANRDTDAMLDQAQQAYLEVQPWWLEHLNQKQLSEVGSTDEDYVLRWVYGNIVNAAMERFIEQQRELREGRDRDTSILNLYEQIAHQWRTLQSYSDKRSKLDELRKSAKMQFDLAQRLRQDPRKCTREQACQFLEAIVLSCGSKLGAGQPVLHINKTVVDALQHNSQLTQEASKRYARALMERELAVLQLVEAMLRHVSQESKREGERADDQLRRLRQELRDAESELQRVETEGPANHRRRDILDKATKEAEHREKLQGLKQRILLGKDRITAEEASCVRWQKKLQEACRDLTTVEEWLKQHTTRNRDLDDICSQLEHPPSMIDAGCESAEECALDASSKKTSKNEEKLEHSMYRVLWVAEAIKKFDDRYIPQTGGKPYQLFSKAARWAKQLCMSYEDRIHCCFDELEKLRQKLQAVACVDQAYDICAYTLKVIRRETELAASRAREEASKQLLHELEQEEAAKRAENQIAKNKKELKRLTKRQKAERAQREKAEKDRARQEKLAREEEQARKRAEEEQKAMAKRLRQAREAAIEAELEKRRIELEVLHTSRSQDATHNEEPGSKSKSVLDSSDSLMKGRSAGEVCSVTGFHLCRKKGCSRSDFVEPMSKTKRHERRKAAQVAAGGVVIIGSTQAKKDRSQDCRVPGPQDRISVPRSSNKKGRKSALQEKSGQRNASGRAGEQASVVPGGEQSLQASSRSARRGCNVQQQVLEPRPVPGLQGPDEHDRQNGSHRQDPRIPTLAADCVGGHAESTLVPPCWQSNRSNTSSTDGTLSSQQSNCSSGAMAQSPQPPSSGAGKGLDTPSRRPTGSPDSRSNAKQACHEPRRTSGNCGPGPPTSTSRCTPSISSSVAVVVKRSVQAKTQGMSQPSQSVDKQGGPIDIQQPSTMSKASSLRSGTSPAEGAFSRCMSDSQVLREWTNVPTRPWKDGQVPRGFATQAIPQLTGSHGASVNGGLATDRTDSVRWCTGGYHNLSDDPVWQEVLAQARERRSPNVAEVSSSGAPALLAVPQGLEQQPTTGLSLNVNLNLNVNVSQPAESQVQLPPVSSSVSVHIEGHPVVIGSDKDAGSTAEGGVVTSGGLESHHELSVAQHSHTVPHQESVVGFSPVLPQPYDLSPPLGTSDGEPKAPPLRQGFGMHKIWGGAGMDGILGTDPRYIGMTGNTAGASHLSRGAHPRLSTRGRSMDMDMGMGSTVHHSTFGRDSHQMKYIMHPGFVMDDADFKHSAMFGPQDWVAPGAGMWRAGWRPHHSASFSGTPSQMSARGRGEAHGSSMPAAAASGAQSDNWRFPQ